jgi:hypothetical protein
MIAVDRSRRVPPWAVVWQGEVEGAPPSARRLPRDLN